MRAAILSLLVALPLFAQFDGTYTIDPVPPTDRSFVVLQIRETWRDGCLPRGERVSRDGNAFTVLYQVPQGVACPAALFPWNEEAPLGVLPAGSYTVSVQVDGFNGRQTLATVRFVVIEAEPALHVSPRLASTGGGTEIAIRNVCSGTLMVDGAIVPSRIEDCRLIATLPPHAPGPVSVRVGSTQVVNAVQYVDPAAPPDPLLYERVLIPILFRGAGAFSSEWETDAMMQTADAFGVLPNVSSALRANTSLWTLFGNQPMGLVLFLPRGADAQFTNHVRDLSRDASQWGTEVPVVRERDTRSRIVLDNVPFDPRYRLHLRIYGIDGIGMQLRIAAGTQSSSGTMRGPCTKAPCNSSAPAHASDQDLRQMFPRLTGMHTVEVEHLAVQPRRIWAFISVTNNETQHVTVISPQ